MRTNKKYQYKISFILYYPYKVVLITIFNTLKEANNYIRFVDDRLKYRYLIKRVKITNEA